MAKKPEAMPAPHSWGFGNWPAHVWPGDVVRGKRFCRTYQPALMKAKALVRLGRELVVMGGPFTAYMAKQAAAVENFSVPCNRPEHAAKRHNGAATTYKINGGESHDKAKNETKAKTVVN
jgi:hypothetical protein